MTTVGEIYEYMDRIAPFELAESWDNSGLLCGSSELPADSVLVSLDITSEVAQEAAEIGAQLIVSHHPVIFEPLKSLSPASVPWRLAASGISAICAHTNLDIAAGGVNDCLAQRLCLNNRKPLQITGDNPSYKVIVFVPAEQAERVYIAMAEAGAGTLGSYSGCAFLSAGEGRFLPHEGAHPFIGETGKLAQVPEVRIEMFVTAARLSAVKAAMLAAHPYEQPAYDVFLDEAVKDVRSLGLIGELPAEYSPEEFAAFVRERLGCTGVRFACGGHPIRNVAVCGGAGGSLWSHVVGGHADAFVTGDVKHNLLIDAKEAGITIVDAGHFATENVVVEPLAQRLSQQFPDVQFTVSRACKDPAEYCFG